MTNKIDHNVFSDLLNTEQTAKKIGKSPATLKRWADSKEGPPFIEIRGRRYYPTSTLSDWMRTAR